MIFGTGNVIDASVCFGKDARSITENTVWWLRGDLLTRDDLSLRDMRDLTRGEMLLHVMRRRFPRKPRYVIRQGGGDSAA